MKGFVKEMSFKSGVKGRGSDRKNECDDCDEVIWRYAQDEAGGE